MSMSHLAEDAAALWRAFMALSETPVEARLYDVMTIGETAAMADEGARAVLAGEKTATASLRQAYAVDVPPPIGSYSILLDGRGRAVGVIQTTRLELKRFDEVDHAFAWDYGAWDRTLATWRARMMSILAAKADDLGFEWDESAELVCETFRLVFPAP